MVDNLAREQERKTLLVYKTKNSKKTKLSIKPCGTIYTEYGVVGPRKKPYRNEKI